MEETRRCYLFWFEHSPRVSQTDMPLAKTRYTIAFRGSKKFFYIQNTSSINKWKDSAEAQINHQEDHFHCTRLYPRVPKGGQCPPHAPPGSLVATPMPVFQKRRDWSGTSHQCPPQSLTHPGCAAHDKVGFSVHSSACGLYLEIAVWE